MREIEKLRLDILNDLVESNRLLKKELFVLNVGIVFSACVLISIGLYFIVILNF